MVAGVRMSSGEGGALGGVYSEVMMMMMFTVMIMMALTCCSPPLTTVLRSYCMCRFALPPDVMRGITIRHARACRAQFCTVSK